MYTCRNCSRTFPTELALDLHRDGCEEGELLCRVCGSRFREAAATTDGWHYACPTEGCGGEGRGEDVVEVDRAQIRQ